MKNQVARAPDNSITNDIENVLHTGTISDKISHHFPIVQIFHSNLKPIKKIQLSVSNTMTTVTLMLTNLLKCLRKILVGVQ